MSGLRIQSLGTFRVWRQGELIPTDAWPTNKTKALFKILLTERGHFVSADRLIDYLWSGTSPDKAQNSLWVAVSQVRRLLEPDLPRRAPSTYILTSHEGYTFNTENDYWLDVEAFTNQLKIALEASEDATQIEAFEAARQFYRGGYLEEDPFEDWAVVPREQLSRDYLTLLANLAEAYALQGRYRRAIALCHESLAIDNIREATYRQLMLYHYTSGEQNLALKAYDECVRSLQEELGVEPMQETTDLCQQLQRREGAAAEHAVQYPSPVQAISMPYTLSQTPFVGQDTAFGQMAGAAAEAVAGRGQVVLVEGEAGIGKSRLIQEAAGFAHERGLSILQVRCYQAERTISYQPIVALLRLVVEDKSLDVLQNLPSVWLAEIATLIPELTERIPGLSGIPSDIDPNRQTRLFQALVEFIAGAASKSGLMLTIDDIHWADETSLQFLNHLARHIADKPVMLVCTYRSDEVAVEEHLTDFVYGLKRETSVSTIKLARLSPEDVEALLEPMAGEATQITELGRWLHAETDGNPFFVVSILQSLLEQELLTIENGGGIEWQTGRTDLFDGGATLTLPDALRESVRDRLRRVPKRARRILDVAGTLGRRFDLRLLQALMKEPEDVLADAIEDLVVRQLLREEQEGRSYDFSHDKIREVVYQDISAARRTLLHRGAASYLVEQLGDEARLSQTWEGMPLHWGSHPENAGIPVEVDQVAYHFVQAGEWQSAFQFALLAAERSAAVYAVDAALNWSDEALMLVTDGRVTVPPIELIDAYLLRCTSQWLLGYFAAAVADGENALRLAREGDDWQRESAALHWLSHIHVGQGLYGEARQLAQQALEIVEAHEDQVGLARVLLNLGTAYVTGALGERGEGLVYLEKARPLCEALGDRQGLAHIEVEVGHMLILWGEYDQARGHLEHAVELARELRDPVILAKALTYLGHTMRDVGEFDASAARLHEAWRVAEARDLGAQAGFAVATLSSVYLLQGDYEQALEMAERSVRMLEAIDAKGLLPWALTCLGDVHRELGARERALNVYERGLKLAREVQDPCWESFTQTGRGLCRILGDDHTAGLSDLQVAATLCERTENMYSAATTQALVRLATGHIAANSPADALRIASEAVAMSEASSLLGLGAESRWLVGLAYSQLEQWPKAEAELRNALTTVRDLVSPTIEWRIHHALGDLYQRQGEGDGARQAYTQAATIIDKLSEQAGSEAARQTFLDRPEVQAALGQGAARSSTLKD